MEEWSVKDLRRLRDALKGDALGAAWFLRQIWSHRLGPEKWDPRHGSTQSFKAPGKLEQKGAVIMLDYLVNRAEEMAEIMKERGE